MKSSRGLISNMAPRVDGSATNYFEQMSSLRPLVDPLRLIFCGRVGIGSEADLAEGKNLISQVARALS